MKRIELTERQWMKWHKGLMNSRLRSKPAQITSKAIETDVLDRLHWQERSERHRSRSIAVPGLELYCRRVPKNELEIAFV